MAYMRRGRTHRTDALETAIGAALGHFTPAGYASYLRHCGYPQSGR